MTYLRKKVLELQFKNEFNRTGGVYISLKHNAPLIKLQSLLV